MSRSSDPTRDAGDAKSTGKLDESAEKVRRSAEPQAGRSSDDTETVEAHTELTRPEHSKGRPSSGDGPAGPATTQKKRVSNAGNDGP